MQKREGTTAVGPLLAGLAVLAVAPLVGPGPASTRSPQPTLLVLGAAQYNGRPSPAFRLRLDRAAALYRAGGVRQIVVSGGVGRGDRYSEGRVGAAYLRAHGVPAARLTVETRSHSTLENLRYSAPLLRGPVTLVTDEAHADRALALANAVGLVADVSSVPLRDTPANFRYKLREKLLLAAYTLFGLDDRHSLWSAPVIRTVSDDD